MDRSNVMYLIKETATQDEIGQFISTEEKRLVYCDVRSVSRSEWFEAGRDGLQPSFVLVTFRPDYDLGGSIFVSGRRCLFSASAEVRD